MPDRRPFAPARAAAIRAGHPIGDMRHARVLTLAGHPAAVELLQRCDRLLSLPEHESRGIQRIAGIAVREHVPAHHG